MSRISADALLEWSSQVLATVGVPPEHAAHISRCLVDVDLRGVRSHGTRQLRRYVTEFRDGLINPTPEVKVLQNGPTHVRLDGDGGAGYLVATRAADAACNKALESGVALATTCHHGHVGSAGIYARRAVDRGLISWVIAGGTGWQPPQDDVTVWDAMKAPPLCFGVPAADGGPPLVLDMNANQFGSADNAQDAIAAGFGKSVFGSLGMRFVSTLLGGLLAGASTADTASNWSAATRGFFYVVIDPALVGDGDAFRAEVRRIIDTSLELQPMRGTDTAALPGTLEWRREREWVTEGIPVSADHQERLEMIALELGLDLPPWDNE